MSVAAASAAPTATNQDSPVTMATTASQLARAFSIMVRQVTDLLNQLPYYQVLTQSLQRNLEVTPQEEHNLQVSGRKKELIGSVNISTEPTEIIYIFF